MMIATPTRQVQGLGNAPGTLTFTASRSNLSQLQIGDTWRLEIRGSTPYASVTGAAYHDGNYSSVNAGVTDSLGNFALQGTFDNASVGVWQQAWRVDGSQIGNMVQFTVQGPAYVIDLTSPASGQAATIEKTMEPAGIPVISGYGGTTAVAQQLAQQVGTEATDRLVTGQSTPSQLGIPTYILPPSLVTPLEQPPATVTYLAPTATQQPNALLPTVTPLVSSANPLGPSTIAPTLAVTPPATAPPPTPISTPVTSTPVAVPPSASVMAPVPTVPTETQAVTTPAVSTSPTGAAASATAPAGTLFGIDEKYVLIGGAALLALLLLGRR